MNTRTIDPFNATSEDLEDLGLLIKQNPLDPSYPDVYKSKNHEIVHPDSNEKKTFFLAHPIFKRARSYSKVGERFVAMGEKPIGAGTFASVSPVKTFAFEEDGSFIPIRQNKAEIVKNFKPNAKEKPTLPNIQKEINLLEQAGNFNPKPFTTVFENNNGKYSVKNLYVVMRKAFGDELFDLIKDSHLGSITRMLKICKEAARNLAAVHAHNIIHCDIKADNIMVDCDKNNLDRLNQLRIIDFGLAENNNNVNPDSKKSQKGTPGYIAPEVLTEGNSFASDVYSLGIIFIWLWDGEVTLKHDFYNMIHWNELFSRHPQLEEPLQKALRTLFIHMVALKNYRLTAQQVFERLQAIEFDYHMSNASIQTRVAAEQGFSLGKLAHNDINLIAALDLNHILKILPKSLNHYITQLTSDEAWQQFKEVIDLNTLRNIATTEEAIIKVQSVCDTAQHNMLQLGELQKNINNFLTTTPSAPNVPHDLFKRIDTLLIEINKTIAKYQQTLSDRPKILNTLDHLNDVATQSTAKWDTFHLCFSLLQGIIRYFTENSLATEVPSVGSSGARISELKLMQTLLTVAKHANEKNADEILQEITVKLEIIQPGFFGKSKFKIRIEEILQHHKKSNTSEKKDTIFILH